MVLFFSATEYRHWSLFSGRLLSLTVSHQDCNIMVLFSVPQNIDVGHCLVGGC